MRAAISLLVLLLSMCGAQTRNTQTDVQTESQTTGAAAAAAAEVSTQLDVSAELKELRDMVVEQRVMLRYTQDDVKLLEAENMAVNQRLAASESKVEVLEAENEAVKERLSVSEADNVGVKERLAVSETKVEALERALQDTKAEMKMEVDNLKKENAAQEAELAALKTRLAATESAIQDLNMDSAAHKQELAALKTGLAATETEVENLENEIRAAPKVAFSAGLTTSGFIESGSNDLNLVFSKVFTNVGQAYSSTSGFFTAPVRGVYYFRFTVMDQLDSRSMVIRMNKNGQQLMQLYEYDTDGYHTYLPSGLTLQLEEGDTVNMVLPAHRKLYDDSRNHSIFSGFLLFPL